MTTIPIPDDVRDNSETVTDFAFMRHLAPDRGVRTPAQRDDILRRAREPFTNTHGYYVKTWETLTNEGQRCRRDVVTTWDGRTVYDFRTLHFTRVACVTHDAYYATFYASVTDQDGVTTIPAAYCDECVSHLRRSVKDSGMTLNLSERLRVGQHD